MMIYWIIIIFLSLIILSIYLLLELKRINKLNNILTTEVVETKKRPIIMGKITKYEEEELNLLFSNPEVIDLLIRIYEFKIFKKTDSIRSLENTEQKVGHLDCLHESHLFFYKLKQKLNKKIEKVWQNLV